MWSVGAGGVGGVGELIMRRKRRSRVEVDMTGLSRFASQNQQLPRVC